MKAEKTLMLTGKQYQDVKAYLQTNESYAYNSGTDLNPEIINITDIALDTDPEFSRNPKQFAKVHEDKHVQVVAEYDDGE
ncbi:hypothetical protein [Mucilaginibacter sp.]